MPLRDRIEAAQERLHLNSQQMAAALRITPEWLSKITNGRADGSEDLGLRLDDFLRRKGIEPNSIHGGLPESAVSETSSKDYVKTRRAEAGTAAGKGDRSDEVAFSREANQRTPSTRADCEVYFADLLDRAERDGDPDNFPAIMRRLRKQFPLDEFASTADDES